MECLRLLLRGTVWGGVLATRAGPCRWRDGA